MRGCLIPCVGFGLSFSPETSTGEVIENEIFEGINKELITMLAYEIGASQGGKCDSKKEVGPINWRSK